MDTVAGGIASKLVRGSSTWNHCTTVNTYFQLLLDPSLGAVPCLADGVGK